MWAHTLTVRSSLVVASNVPVSLNATLNIAPSCPLSLCAVWGLGLKGSQVVIRTSFWTVPEARRREGRVEPRKDMLYVMHLEALVRVEVKVSTCERRARREARSKRGARGG